MPVVEEVNVKDLVCKKLKAFDAAIEANENLEIDGIIGGVDGEEEGLKIINHKLQSAFAVSIDTIIKEPLPPVIEVLETGIFIHVYGVTRIVGYYSRVQNWNKSKIGELNDRHDGNYWYEQKQANHQYVENTGPVPQYETVLS